MQQQHDRVRRLGQRDEAADVAVSDDAATPAPGEPPPAPAAPAAAASPDATARVTKQVQALAALVAALGTLVAAGYGLVKIFADDGGGQISKTAELTIGEASPQGSQATFPVTIDVSGQKGHAVDVRWTLMDAERNRPVVGTDFQNKLIASFKPEADRVQRVFQTVVPAPSGTSIVFLRVTARDDVGEQIALADSDRLDLGGVDP